MFQLRGGDRTLRAQERRAPAPAWLWLTVCHGQVPPRLPPSLPRPVPQPCPCLPAFQMEQLANPKAWISAATQIFFSLGLGFGSLIAFASYSEPSNDCQKHAVLVSLINSSTSIFASIVTFSIYGFKATFNYESCMNK